MSVSTPALLIAAAGVGLGHAVLPDHWVPLAVLGRTRRSPLREVAKLSALAGVAHVLVSVVLGGIIILIGLQLRSSITHIQDTLVGLILIATGAAFALLELTGHGHSHSHEHGAGHDHSHGHSQRLLGRRHSHEHDLHEPHEHGAHVHTHDPHSHHGHSHATQRRAGGRLAMMIPFGAAASPDLTILPVFLAATAAGTSAAIGSVVVFAIATIATIVGLTVLGAATGRLVKAHWLEEWGNAITAIVLVAIGLLVLTGTI